MAPCAMTEEEFLAGYEARARRPACLLGRLDRITRGWLATAEEEEIDSAGVPDERKRAIMENVLFLNAALGVYSEAFRLLRPLVRQAHRAEGRPVRILDVGCGHGDTLAWMHRRFARAGIPVEMSGVDLSDKYVTMARQRLAESGVPAHLFQGDAARLALGDGAVDLCLSMQTMHHLSPLQVFRMAREMRRVARHGAAVMDLRRALHAYAGMWVTFHLYRGACGHDGIVSSRRAYSIRELRFILESAGLAPIRSRPSFTFCLLAARFR